MEDPIENHMVVEECWNNPFEETYERDGEDDDS